MHTEPERDGKAARMCRRGQRATSSPIIIIGCSLALALLTIGQQCQGKGLSLLLGEKGAAELELAKLCGKVHSIKKISEMRKLIKSLKTLTDNGETPHSHSKSPLRYLTPKPSEPCLAQAPAFLDLGDIIDEKVNVCSSDHVTKLEHYYDEHLRSYMTSSTLSPLHLIGHDSRPLTLRFFMWYAKQVSFACKSNFFRSLRIVEEANIVSDYDFELALPWLSRADFMTSEHTPFEKDSSQHEHHQQPPLTKKRAHQQSKARSALEELTDIDELAILLNSDDAVLAMNEQQQQQPEAPAGATSANMDSNDDSGADDANQNVVLLVPESRMKMVTDITMACSKFKPIYEQVVMPIVRLARLGASPEFDKFEEACKKKPEAKKWFGLTLVCETMLKSRLVKANKDEHVKEDGLVVVGECDEAKISCEQIETKNYGSHVPSLIEQKVKGMLRIKIEDELWISKYDKTPIRRLTDNFEKKWIKTFNIDNVHDHVNFIHMREHAKRVSVRLAVSILVASIMNMKG